MSPHVSQILHRREEIATHQRALKDLEANLNADETKELAEAEKAAKKEAAPKPSPGN